MPLYNRKVVLADIAKRADVHISTVSLALRNSPKIAAKTREHIRQIAHELNYQPDPNLNSLIAYRRDKSVRHSNASIAIISDINDPVLYCESSYLNGHLSGIYDRAHTLGYNASLFIKGIDFDRSEQLDRILIARGIKGIIFNSIYDPNTRFALNWDNYACVKINLLPRDLPIDSVSVNSSESVRIAFNKALELGHKRIALATSEEDNLHLEHGYVSSFLRMQMKVDPGDRVSPFIFPRRSEYNIWAVVKDWLREVNADALLSNWTLGEAARQLTVEDGQTCRFISLEVEDEANNCGGAQSNYYVIGSTAVERLVEKLQHNHLGIPEISVALHINPKWIELKEWPPRDAFSMIDVEAEYGKLPLKACIKKMPSLQTSNTAS